VSLQRAIFLISNNEAKIFTFLPHDFGLFPKFSLTGWIFKRLTATIAAAMFAQ